MLRLPAAAAGRLLQLRLLAACCRCLLHLRLLAAGSRCLLLAATASYSRASVNPSEALISAHEARREAAAMLAPVEDLALAVGL